MNKKLNIALWTVQVLLAMAFAFAGFGKVTSSAEELIAMGMTYINSTGIVPTRIAGISELAAAVGLIFPAALRISPRLTGWAGAGLVVVMALAAVLHAALGEFAALPANIVLGGLAGFVAWGRLKAAPIAPKA